MGVRVFVFGAGAVGCFLGGVLAAGGAGVTLIGRERIVAPAAARGLTIATGDGRSRTVAVGAATGLAEARSRFGEPDLVLLAMKAFGTAGAAAELAAAWGGGGPCVLSVQNGVGNEETLAAAVGEERVIAGALTVAVSMPEPAVVKGHQRRGGVALAPLARPGQGPAAALAPALLGCLRQGGLEAVAGADWRGVKWSKLLLNLLGNATSAILDMPPAEALAHPGVFRLERDAFREALRVMDRLRIPVLDLPGYPVRLLSHLLRHLPAPVAQRLLYRRLAGGRGGKLPSLLVDLRAGRARTEAAFLNGAVSRHGRLAAVPTPVNDLLAELVTGIAAGAIPWEIYRRRPESLLREARGEPALGA